ncbi:MAG: hypothetical protein HMLKMBBP_03745 [Planctomycetes bacterium]|nr:hypothetical protein [Planctomycetota bacterium]
MTEKPEPADMNGELTGGIAMREFAGYQILERASVDAAAGTVTYRARQKSLGRMVRVTVLPRASAAKPGFLARFRRKVAVASRIQHDHVLTALDAGTASGIAYVVFEDLDGATLAETVRRSGPLPAARVAEVGAGIARALDHLATLGLVHRNVRAETIHLPEHSPAKLTGLGLAKVRVTSGAETWIDHEMEGLDTMAPETVKGARPDVRSDIYGLGCALYLAATGRPVFGGGNVASLLARHATELPGDPRFFAAVPEPLVRILDRCLRKSPDERYAKAADLARDLDLVRLAKAGEKVTIDRGPGAPLFPDATPPSSPGLLGRLRPGR